MIRYLVKAGAMPFEGNAVRKVLEMKSKADEKLSALKGLINHHGCTPPVDLNALKEDPPKDTRASEFRPPRPTKAPKTAIEALHIYGTFMASPRLVKFLVKNGARVSWAKLYEIAYHFGVEENTLL